MYERAINSTRQDSIHGDVSFNCVPINYDISWKGTIIISKYFEIQT